MSIPAKVAVIILNWNGKKYLEEFLPSVVDSTYPELELIVADNASTDESVEFLRAVYPDVRIILNSGNLGFAKGYNEALKVVEADYFILLNSDVKVGPNWIEPVIRAMEADPSIAAAQPKILSYRDPALFEHAGASGGFIDTLGYPFCRGRIFDTVEQDQAQYNDTTEIFWASGAAFFIRKTAWETAGGFDADFFAHMEEIDLCWRLKNMGFRLIVCPESVVYHLGGGSLSSDSPYKTYLNFRNNLFMVQKNLPAFQAALVIFVRFWLDFVALVRFLMEGKSAHAREISRAHTHFLRDIFKTGRKASKVEKSRLNTTGLYRRSIVWDYFVKGRKTYREL